MRRFVTAFFFVALSPFFPAYGAEILSFGNSEGFHHVIAVPVREGEPEDAALFYRGKAFFEALSLESRLPNARISLIMTDNDYSRLPEGLRPAVPEGAAEIISLLERSAGAVILVLPEEKAGKTVVKCGVKGKTSPPALLSALVSGLENSGITWQLEESHLDLYRIGWAPESHILKAYFDSGIPAVAVSTASDIFPAIAETVRSLSDQNSAAAFSSQNYSLLKVPSFLEDAAKRLFPPLFSEESGKSDQTGGIPPAHLAGGSFIVLSERFMVSAAIFFFSCFLLYLCVLFLISPETRKRRAKKFWKALPFPVLFAIANFFAMHLGGCLASALVSLRFGKPDAWILIPRAAIFTKLSCAFLVASLISSLRKRFPLGRDPVSLGYVASISSFVNIFIFSALDFSMALSFIACHVLLLACAHTESAPAQAVLAVLAAAVFAHLYAQIFCANTAAISALYSNEGGWNALAACFVLPFQLAFSRIAEKSGARLKLSLSLPFPTKRRVKMRAPVMPLAALAFLAASATVVFSAPAWSRDKPLPVVISQSVTEEGLSVTLDCPASLENIELSRAQSAFAGSSSPLAPRPEDFISANFSSRDFLDRKVYELAVSPHVNARRIDILISCETGIAVNISQLPFQIEHGGRKALFTSGENPETPIRVSFITGTADSLQAEISCWSTENPFGFYIEDERIAASNLLFIKKEIELIGR